MFSLFGKKQRPLEITRLDNTSLTSSLIKLATEEAEALFSVTSKVSIEQELRIRLECIETTFSLILFLYDDVTKTEKSGLLKLHYPIVTEEILNKQLLNEILKEFSSYNEYCQTRFEYFESEIATLLNDEHYTPVALSTTLFLLPLKPIPTLFTGSKYVVEESYLQLGNLEYAFKLKIILMQTLSSINRKL